MLIKGEQTAHAEVVDGQQRLTTLTILLAVLAKVLPTEARDIETFPLPSYRGHVGRH